MVSRSVADQAAASAHADRMRDVARIENANPSRTESLVSQVAAYAAEAELWRAAGVGQIPRNRQGGDLVVARRGRTCEAMTAKGLRPKPEPQELPRPGQDPRSQQIIAKLGELVPMKFLEETPLEDIIKHIRKRPSHPTCPAGIPIYVDPVGLSEADKTMTSTVRSIDLEGVPLRRTLQLALAQLDLGYFVVDGMLYITSLESADNGSYRRAMPTPSPRMEKLEKAERGELTLDEMKDLIEMLKCQARDRGDSTRQRPHLGRSRSRPADRGR